MNLSHKPCHGMFLQREGIETLVLFDTAAFGGEGECVLSHGVQTDQTSGGTGTEIIISCGCVWTLHSSPTVH